MRVSNNYVAYFGSLIGREGNRYTASINRHAIVDKKTGQTLLKGCVALAVKSTG